MIIYIFFILLFMIELPNILNIINLYLLLIKISIFIKKRILKDLKNFFFIQNYKIN